MIRASRQTAFRPRVERLEGRVVPSFLPGNEFLANQSTGASGLGDISASVAAATVDGRFVVTYTQENAYAVAVGVFARVFNADGTPLTDEFQVSQHAYASTGISRVAVDAAGDFVIVWLGEDTAG